MMNHMGGLRLALLAVFFASAWSSPLSAQTLSSILARSDYTPAERGEIASDFQRFSSEGIPQEMLLPKLQEGIAKRIPFPSLISAMRKSAASIEMARTILLSEPHGSRLVADRAAWSLAAMLLDTGAPKDVIASLAQRSGGESATYRSSALLYGALVSWGLSSEASLEVAEAAEASRLSPVDYAGIVDLFAQGRAMSIPPAGITERVLAVLPKARSFEELRRDVLY